MEEPSGTDDHISIENDSDGNTRDAGHSSRRDRKASRPGRHQVDAENRLFESDDEADERKTSKPDPLRDSKSNVGFGQSNSDLLSKVSALENALEEEKGKVSKGIAANDDLTRVFQHLQRIGNDDELTQMVRSEMLSTVSVDHVELLMFRTRAEGSLALQQLRQLSDTEALPLVFQRSVPASAGGEDVSSFMGPSQRLDVILVGPLEDPVAAAALVRNGDRGFTQTETREVDALRDRLSLLVACYQASKVGFTRSFDAELAKLEEEQRQKDVQSESDKRKLREKLTVAKSEIVRRDADLGQVRNELQRSVEKYQSHKSKSKEEKQTLQKSLDEKRLELQQSQSSLEEIKGELREAVNERTQTCARMEGEISARDARLEQLRSEYSSEKLAHEKDVFTFTAEKDELTRRIVALEGQVHDLSTKNISITQSLSDTREQLAVSKEEERKLERTLAVEENKYRDLVSQKDEMEQELKGQVEQSKRAHEFEVAQLTHQMEGDQKRAEERLQSTIAEYDLRLEKQEATYESQISHLKERHSSAEATLNRKINLLEQTVSEREARIVNLDREVEKEKERNHTLECEVSSFKARNDALQSKVTQGERRNATLAAKLEQESLKVTQVSRENEGLRSTVSALESQLQDAKSEVRATQRELETTQQTVIAHEHTIEKQETSIEKLTTNLEEATFEIKTLREESRRLENELKSAERRVQNLSNENVSLKEQVSTAKAQISSLQQALDKKTEEANSLAGEVVRQQGRVASLEQQNKELHNTITEVKHDKMRVEQALESTRSQLNDISRECEEAKQRVTTLTHEKKALNEDLGRVKNKLEETRRKADTLEQQLALEIQERQAEKRHFQVQIEEGKEKANRLSSEKDKVTMELKNTQERFRTTVQEMKDTHMKELQRTEAFYVEKMALKDEHHQNELKQIRETSKNRIQEMENHFQKEKEDLILRNEEEMTTLRERHVEETSRTAEFHEKQVKGLEETLLAVKTECENRVEELDASFKARVKEMEQKHAKDLRRMEDDMKARFESEYLSKEAEMKLSHANRINELTATHEVEVTQLKERHESTESDLKNQLDIAENAHEPLLRRISAEREAHARDATRFQSVLTRLSNIVTLAAPKRRLGRFWRRSTIIVQSILGCDYCGLFLVDSSRDFLELKSYYTKEREKSGEVHSPVNSPRGNGSRTDSRNPEGGARWNPQQTDAISYNMSGTGVLASVAATGRTIVLDSLRSHPRYSRDEKLWISYLPRSDVQSTSHSPTQDYAVMCCPLVDSDGKVIAVFHCVNTVDPPTEHLDEEDGGSESGEDIKFNESTSPPRVDEYDSSVAQRLTQSANAFSVHRSQSLVAFTEKAKNGIFNSRQESFMTWFAEFMTSLYEYHSSYGWATWEISQTKSEMDRLKLKVGEARAQARVAVTKAERSNAIVDFFTAISDAATVGVGPVFRAVEGLTGKVVPNLSFARFFIVDTANNQVFTFIQDGVEPETVATLESSTNPDTAANVSHRSHLYSKPDPRRVSYSIDKGICGYVGRTGRTVNCTISQGAKKFDTSSHPSYVGLEGGMAILAVPVLNEDGRIMGVVELGRYVSRRRGPKDESKWAFTSSSSVPREDSRDVRANESVWGDDQSDDDAVSLARDEHNSSLSLGDLDETAHPFTEDEVAAVKFLSSQINVTLSLIHDMHSARSHASKWLEHRKGAERQTRRLLHAEEELERATRELEGKEGMVIRLQKVVEETKPMQELSSVNSKLKLENSHLHEQLRKYASTTQYLERDIQLYKSELDKYHRYAMVQNESLKGAVTDVKATLDECTSPRVLGKANASSNVRRYGSPAAKIYSSPSPSQRQRGDRPIRGEGTRNAYARRSQSMPFEPKASSSQHRERGVSALPTSSSSPRSRSQFLFDFDTLPNVSDEEILRSRRDAKPPHPSRRSGERQSVSRSRGHRRSSDKEEDPFFSSLASVSDILESVHLPDEDAPASHWGH